MDLLDHRISGRLLRFARSSWGSKQLGLWRVHGFRREQKSLFETATLRAVFITCSSLLCVVFFFQYKTSECYGQHLQQGVGVRGLFCPSGRRANLGLVPWCSPAHGDPAASNRDKPNVHTAPLLARVSPKQSHPLERQQEACTRVLHLAGLPAWLRIFR